MDLAAIMMDACVAQASDIHLQGGTIPLYRVHGELRRAPWAELSSPELLESLAPLISRDAYESLLAQREIDGAFSTSEGRWRLHAYHTERGVGVALRRLPREIPSIDALRLPGVVTELTKLKQGLILVTGATGSGKTTTAASMLNLISHTRACHIVTIEDPIEYLFAPSVGAVSQREVGRHTVSFAQALRAALREDPDVIFVGEMRDLETVQLALQAAETGHLVISTLHTMGASKAVSRIVDIFPSAQQGLARSVIASTLEAIVSQELIPSASGGRVVVPEILLGTPGIRALIRDGKFHQIDHVMQTSLEVGMLTRARSLELLRAQGELPAR